MIAIYDLYNKILFKGLKMFDFLMKPSHKHPKYQKAIQSSLMSPPSPHGKYHQTISLEVIPKFIDNNLQKNKKKQLVGVRKYQQAIEVRLEKQVQETLKGLLEEAKESVERLKANEIIEKEMKERENTAFIRYTSENHHQYLDKLFQKSIVDDSHLKLGLGYLISGVTDGITRDIESNMYDSEVFKKKLLSKEEKQLQHLSQINLIKQKQSQIFSKVGELKLELNFIDDPEVISKAKEIAQKQTYSKNKQKTKEIERFIEMKKQQREEIQRRKLQQIQKQKIKQLQQKVAHQIETQKAKTQRHAKLVEKYQAKQKLKQQRFEQIQNEKMKFANFLKQYRNAKPLYQRKIQQQIESEIKYKKQRFRKMSQRKGKFNPINFQELQDFEFKYLELKREQEEKKKIESLVKKDQQRLRLQEMRDKHYKGKYRYLLLQEMVNKEAKSKEQEFAKKMLLEKKRAYSVDIKEKYKPRIDENKRMEIQRFVSKTQRKRKQKGPRRVRLNSCDGYDLNSIQYEEEEQQEEIKDSKKEGDRNRRLFKQYIQEKIRKGEIKKQQNSQSQFSTVTPRIDYLKEQRENREAINTSFAHQSLDASSRIKKIKSQAKGDIALIKFKAEQLDQKARRQQLKIKYAEHTPNDQKQLEENYLASIQAKLEILNNVK